MKVPFLRTKSVPDKLPVPGQPGWLYTPPAAATPLPDDVRARNAENELARLKTTIGKALIELAHLVAAVNPAAFRLRPGTTLARHLEEMTARDPYEGIRALTDALRWPMTMKEFIDDELGHTPIPPPLVVGISSWSRTDGRPPKFEVWEDAQLGEGHRTLLETEDEGYAERFAEARRRRNAGLPDDSELIEKLTERVSALEREREDT